MKIMVFMKTWTLTFRTQVKVTLLMKTWNDPTVNTNILPQAVSRKTPIENQFLTKVLKVIFSEVWDSKLKQYLTIWIGFCGKFNDNWIRNGSSESQDPFGGVGDGRKTKLWKGLGVPPVPVMLTQYRKKKIYSQEGWWVQWRVAGLMSLLPGYLNRGFWTP